MTTFDPDDIADQVLPLDGPHDADNTYAAAQVIAELVRRLNHATLPGHVDPVLVYPSQVDRIVGALHRAAAGMSQLMRQLSIRMEAFADDPRTGIDELGPAHNPHAVADAAAGSLAAAAFQADETATRLNRARKSTTRLTYREDS